MHESKNENLICESCESEVSDNDSFCQNCGSIFEDGLKCKVHENEEASGVCVICGKAFCHPCLGRIEDVYLCIGHSGYELYEGMARVYGTSDETYINYLKDCLTQDGLHPIIFSRKASPYSLGDVNYSLFRPSGEYKGHIINEVKLMVPFNQVLRAEKLLSSLIAD